MIKQNLTPERHKEVLRSLEKLAILSQLFDFEQQTYLADTRFSQPIANNFARRIGKDVQYIKQHLGNSIALSKTDFAEEYVATLWGILDNLCKVDLVPLKEYAEYLEQSLNGVLE